MNVCTSSGLYGLHIDGRSLASILAVTMLVYTILVIGLAGAGYFLYTRCNTSGGFTRANTNGRNSTTKALSANLLQEDEDYSNEAILGL